MTKRLRTFRYEQVIDAPIDPVFTWFSEPENLAELLRDWPGFRLLRHDGDVKSGSETWVEQMFFGFLPVVSGFRHQSYDPPHAFEESLIHGTFEHFTHRHGFESLEGGTRLTDTLTVRYPLIFGGALVESLFISRWMARFFAYRHQTVERLLREGAFGGESC